MGRCRRRLSSSLSSLSSLRRRFETVFRSTRDSPGPGLPADMREAQEVERLRLTEPPGLPVSGGEPPELDQPSLIGLEPQPEPGESVPQVGRKVAQGHLNYHAVPGNLEAVSDFIYELRRLWMKALRRRSQKTRMSWTRFSRLAAGWLPSIRNMHPYPDRRFAAI